MQALLLAGTYIQPDLYRSTGCVDWCIDAGALSRLQTTTFATSSYKGRGIAIGPGLSAAIAWLFGPWIPTAVLLLTSAIDDHSPASLYGAPDATRLALSRVPDPPLIACWTGAEETRIAETK